MLKKLTKRDIKATILVSHVSKNDYSYHFNYIDHHGNLYTFVKDPFDYRTFIESSSFENGTCKIIHDVTDKRSFINEIHNFVNNSLFNTTQN